MCLMEIFMRPKSCRQEYSNSPPIHTLVCLGVLAEVTLSALADEERDDFVSWGKKNTVLPHVLTDPRCDST